MTLDDWVRNGWLRAHTPSEQQMRNLFAIVDRERADAATTSISLDARLGMLYNAALRLADLALRHCGYRAGHERQHYRVITSLPLTLGNDWKETTRFLERIQKLRHRADYESVGLATPATGTGPLEDAWGGTDEERLGGVHSPSSLERNPIRRRVTPSTPLT